MTYTRFPVVRLRPLSHLCKNYEMIAYGVTLKPANNILTFLIKFVKDFRLFRVVYFVSFQSKNFRATQFRQAKEKSFLCGNCVASNRGIV